MGLPHYRKVRRCIFCPKKPGSGEHGWSAWAIDRFSTPTHRIAGQVDGKPHFDRHQKAIKIPCVCTFCNTGWMSGLESAVSPIIGKMGDGDHARLDVEQQWTI